MPLYTMIKTTYNIWQLNSEKDNESAIVDLSVEIVKIYVEYC